MKTSHQDLRHALGRLGKPRSYPIGGFAEQDR